MNLVLVFILGLLQISLLDLVLCGDNVGVIALATRNLPNTYAKKANAIGVAMAVSLRIFFASILTVMISIQWLPIKFVGGLILVKITWDLIKPQKEEENLHVKSSQRFWGAVGTIILADVSMSLDNVLAIASAANGDFWLIIFGLALNIPIIFFGSQIVMKLMQKYPIVIYIGGAVLARTSFNMIFEDNYVVKYIPHLVGLIVPFVMAAATLVYGVVIIRSDKKRTEAAKETTEETSSDKADDEALAITNANAIAKDIDIEKDRRDKSTDTLEITQNT